jgi:hypothetical protein
MNFPTFNWTRKFIAISTTARHWFLSWTRWIQYIPPHYICVRSILILSYHLRLVVSLLLSFQPKSYAHSSSLLCVLPDHSNYLRAKGVTYQVPHYASFSSLLLFHLSWVQIFSSAPCSQTRSVYVLSLMSDKVRRSYKIKGKNIVFCILIFFRQKFLLWMIQVDPEFNLLWISSLIKFWFMTVVPKYWNFAKYSKELLATSKFVLSSDDKASAYN